MINFISNLPARLRSGGFSALGAASLAALERSHAAHFVGPVDPPAFPIEQAVSKIRRTAGLPGSYFFFSERRLKRIAAEVAGACRSEATLDYFHGFTPWIATRPSRPYVACSDCTFRDYVSNYHVREKFSARDLERIENTEREWLRKAARVLFTSHWAANLAAADYGLDPARMGVVGIFGELEMPAADSYSAGAQFAFLSTNFEAKGGRTVLEAFRRVRASHPEATLIVVGDHPPGLAEAGVTACGFLRKEVPTEHSRYRDILAHARAIVHPTRSDSAPLIVIEAGYFGCPAISSRRFAIPELIDDRASGLLVDDPTNVAELAGAMAWMLDNEHAYRGMRGAARSKALWEHSKANFEERLLGQVREAAGA